MRGRGLRSAVLIAGSLVACVATWTPPAPVGWHRTAAVGEEGDNYPIGAGECTACHEDVQGHAPAPEYHADCESCHGMGGLHFESEEPGDIRYPSNADCESCHDTGHRTLMAWSSDPHARSGVLCSDCHASHQRDVALLRRVPATQATLSRHATPKSQLCGSCHADVASRFRLPSHHPVGEGMLDCTDCHRPHQSMEASLGADIQRCTSCHQDVSGPWIHEHGPVAEDCSACHVPHGASNDALVEPGEPGVCIQCHSIALSGAVHEPWAFTNRCTECHSAVHGSFADPYLRR